MITVPGGERWRTVETGESAFDVHEHGWGPAVILVGTGLVADRLLPLAREPVLAQGRRVIAYRRRGYGGSGPVGSPGSLERDAGDCLALMDALGIEHAALVGFAHSAAVALETAAESPGRVDHLCLIDPPPLQASCSGEYRTANAELLAEYQAIGAWPAADRYLWRLMDRGWRLDLERLIPGSVADVERDAATFFTADLPALMSWNFARADAERIAAPVLLVSGTLSNRWFAEELCELREWLPHSQDAVIPDADHSLVLT
ncbi:alpha/beta hydrolase, partial [Demequina sp.]|uniref:alpha/beta fold hydrolase n=1 Tax=Demequina sp. TaxID=2050685 RepID=UPI0025D6A843